MPSVWIEPRQTRSGRRHRVRFRLGGREGVPRLGGTFKTLREAQARKRWIESELAAMREPILQLVEPEPTETFAAAAARWRRSRVDVAGGAADAHKVNLARLLPTL